jgi:hypothetical protein
VDGSEVVHSFQKKRERKRCLEAENEVRRGEVIHRLLALPEVRNCASEARTCTRQHRLRGHETKRAERQSPARGMVEETTLIYKHSFSVDDVRVWGMGAVSSP